MKYIIYIYIYRRKQSKILNSKLALIVYSHVATAASGRASPYQCVCVCLAQLLHFRSGIPQRSRCERATYLSLSLICRHLPNGAY